MDLLSDTSAGVRMSEEKTTKILSRWLVRCGCCMNFPDVLRDLTSGRPLTEGAARFLMGETMLGQLSEPQIAAWLTALCMRSLQGEEIGYLAAELRQHAVRFAIDSDVLDTCGTGGDGQHTLNVSTLTALVLASQGVPVAKHGNRSVSSSSGSADVLEGLGYPLNEDPVKASERLRRTHFAFLFAPAYHPAMKYAGPVRKAMGIRTVFNILGPLANPALPSVQVIGVYSRDLIRPVASALQVLGTRTGIVLHSHDGLDEMSLFAPTDYAVLQDGEVTEGTFDPVALPRESAGIESIRVHTAAEGLQRARAFLAGHDRAAAEFVGLNAAVAKFAFELHKGEKDSLSRFVNREYPPILEFILSGATANLVKSF